MKRFQFSDYEKSFSKLSKLTNKSYAYDRMDTSIHAHLVYPVQEMALRLLANAKVRNQTKSRTNK